MNLSIQVSYRESTDHYIREREYLELSYSCPCARRTILTV